MYKKKINWRIVISLASKGKSKFQPALLLIPRLWTGTRTVPKQTPEKFYGIAMLFRVPFSHLLSLSRCFLENYIDLVRWWVKCVRNNTSPAVSFPVTWHGTSSLRLVTWKCFAFHPHVIFVKLASQSGNLWFDCVYVVLRDSSKNEFLTIADCSKRSF